LVGECNLQFFDIEALSLPEILEYYMNFLYSRDNLFDDGFVLKQGDQLIFYEYGKTLFEYEYSMYSLSLVSPSEKAKLIVVNKGNFHFLKYDITKKNIQYQFSI